MGAMTVVAWWDAQDGLRKSGIVTGAVALVVLGIIGSTARGSSTPGMRPAAKSVSVKKESLQPHRNPVTVPVSTLAVAGVEPTLMVYVTGAVKRPGIVPLMDGARINDAISAVGGFLPDAERSSINLAQHVVDESQIHVPSKNDAQEAVVQDGFAQAASRGSKVAAAIRTSGRRTGGHPATAAKSGGGKQKWKSPSDGQIVLSKATLADLVHLPGVGDATAQRILDKRKELQGFKSIDQLGEVKGIGKKTLEKLTPFLKL
jgi:competence protein ComEA